VDNRPSSSFILADVWGFLNQWKQAISIEAISMYSKGSICTDFLFAKPSFASGLVRAIDLCGHFDRYNSSGSESEADERAIRVDWLVVGKDMNDAFERVKSK
jgi:hypothetical protein